MDDGHVVVDSIAPIHLRDITDDLARESGFSSRTDLLETARHGRGDNVYLIRFHYLPPGAWDVQRTAPSSPDSTSQLLRRIRNSAPAKLKRGRYSWKRRSSS